MIYQRQKLLLALLHVIGEEVGNLDFQKLLFLYCKDVEKFPSYEFVPYKFGAFSFTSYADKRRLADHGLLANAERVWKLTSQGRKVAEKFQTDTLNQFAKSYSNLRGDELVAETYRRYPYFAIHSNIAERVLEEDRLALVAIEAARPPKKRPGLCTIGYESRSLENYLNRLLTSGVTMLVDVRRNALSRKYGFSKSTLSNACSVMEIRYEHIPELGIASDHRRELKTQEDYDALFENYVRVDLPLQTKALSQIVEWIHQDERIALTCFERLPQQCHRHCVANALEEELGPAVHL